MVNRGDLTESRFVRRATGRALRLTQSAAGRTAKRPETDDSVLIDPRSGGATAPHSFLEGVAENLGQPCEPVKPKIDIISWFVDKCDDGSTINPTR